MPVGTYGVVKTLSPEDIEKLGYELILCNTYHLLLRPGEEFMKRFGGLHKFMNWNKSILTDSGGFQIMSLAKMRRIHEGGVDFRSHIDGALYELTPEKAVQFQKILGVDISVALDICPAHPASKEEISLAVERTTRWAQRSLNAKEENQILFGVTQGGIYEDLRKKSIEDITGMPFDGFAIGGVSVGESKEWQHRIVEFAAPLLPKDRPRYLMGVGKPTDILHAVRCGVDLFDCVLPTRLGRHHALFTLSGIINITNSRFAGLDAPWDPESVFPLTAKISAAYLHHLFKIGEPLAARIASLHNLAFYERLMREIRMAIRENKWSWLEERYKNC